jgi:riboflavin synthase
MTRIQILNNEVIGDLTLFESSSDQQKSIMSLQMNKKVQKAKGIVKVVNTVLDFFGIGAIGMGSEVIEGSDDSAT